MKILEFYLDKSDQKIYLESIEKLNESNNK